MHKLAKFYKPHIARMIEKYRKELNISQKVLAEKLAISERYYYDLKYAHSMMSLVELILFLRLLSDEKKLEVIKELESLIDSKEYQANLVKIDFI